MGTEIKTKSIKPPSYRQQKAIEFWIRGKRKSKAKALREAGYSEAIARQPHKVFDSRAVQRELELRGHGTRGISDNEVPRAEIQETVVEQTPIILSKLTREQIEALKERFAEVPDIPQETHTVREYEYDDFSYTPPENWEGNPFDAPNIPGGRMPKDSFSSM